MPLPAPTEVWINKPQQIIRHGNFMTVVVIINDPVYLAEPFVRTTDFEYDARQEIAPYPCEAVVEVICPKGAVPSHLPGKNVSNVLTRAEDCDISVQEFSKTSNSKCDLINKASHL